MNDDLMKALLSLDAYNRGYNPAVTFGNDPNNSEAINGVTQLGTATVFRSNNSTDAQNASFYAIAYEYNQKVIVSYRGTDNLSIKGGDIPAFFTGGGFDTDQAMLAIKFYQELDKLTSKDISLTGHSLGGGLAGLVSSLLQSQPGYQQAPDAVMFDNMPFELAAKNIYDNSKPYELNGNSYDDGFLSGVKKDVYGDKDVNGQKITAWAPATYTNANSGIHGYSIKGEVLESPIYLRQFQKSYVQTINLAGEAGAPSIEDINVIDLQEWTEIIVIRWHLLRATRL